MMKTEGSEFDERRRYHDGWDGWDGLGLLEDMTQTGLEVRGRLGEREESRVLTQMV